MNHTNGVGGGCARGRTRRRTERTGDVRRDGVAAEEGGDPHGHQRSPPEGERRPALRGVHTPCGRQRGREQRRCLLHRGAGGGRVRGSAPRGRRADRRAQARAGDDRQGRRRRAEQREGQDRQAAGGQKRDLGCQTQGGRARGKRTSSAIAAARRRGRRRARRQSVGEQQSHRGRHARGTRRRAVGRQSRDRKPAKATTRAGTNRAERDRCTARVPRKQTHRRHRQRDETRQVPGGVRGDQSSHRRGGMRQALRRTRSSRIHVADAKRSASKRDTRRGGHRAGAGGDALGAEARGRVRGGGGRSGRRGDAGTRTRTPRTKKRRGRGDGADQGSSRATRAARRRKHSCAA